ncbi:MAG: hypothetical protein LQ338_008141 [Usnochroma carphineum]|nr:MAG: hypothetical protein LQ338_008141 [Usnochroma carphineum]
MTTTCKPTELFGGAITANLPDGYADVSNIREVPDHQEIYLDASGFSSIIIEVAERVSQPATDEEALKFHFQDIVDEHDMGRIWHTEVVQLPHFPADTPCYTLLGTTTLPPATNGNVNRPLTPTFTAIILTLIRLVPQSTDIVVTINIPHIPGHQEPSNGEVDFEEGKLGSLVEEGMRIRDEIWRTLEVRDWGLFGGGEAGEVA